MLYPTRLLLYLAFFTLAGCKGESTPCSAGDVQACLCPDGSPGLQTCLDDGSGWTACSCNSDTSTDAEVDVDEDVPYDGPCRNDGDCSDGLYCNGQELCQEGTCVEGTPVVCDDSDDCTTDICSESETDCVYTDRDEDGDGFVDAACGGSDCDDIRDDTYPGATEESCFDGIDQDCLGMGRSEFLYDDVVLGDMYGMTPEPTWNDSELGYIIDAIFRRITPEGTPVGDPAEAYFGLGYVVGSSAPVWSGSLWAVTWAEGEDWAVYFARLDQLDPPEVDAVQISGPEGGIPRMTWTGSEYALFWTGPTGVIAGDHGIWFARVDADGAEIGSEVLVHDLDAGVADVVWTGERYFVPVEYGIHAGGMNQIQQIMMFGPDGTHLGDADIPADMEAVDIDGQGCLRWTGSRMGMIWFDTSHDTYFSLLDATGAAVGSPVLLAETVGSENPAPGLAWTGSQFMAAWMRGGTDHTYIEFARIDPDGTILEPGHTVKTYPRFPTYPPVNLAWTGSQTAVFWSDREDMERLHYNRIGPCE